MQNRFRSLTLILSSLITLAILVFISGFSDIAFSIIPGWHTVIYPPKMVRIILCFAALGLSLVIYGLFRMVEMLVGKILTKFVMKDKKLDA